MSQLRQPCQLRVSAWLSHRLPALFTWYHQHLVGYRVPRNLNFWYCFGVLLLVLLLNQLSSGIVLASHYVPTTAGAFASVEMTIMREIPFGWLARYLHTTGASLLFAVLSLHALRGLLYGSYRAPRELVWCIGLLLYVLLMGEAVTGYVLPWGQLSYWGARIVVDLVGGVPVVGDGLAGWLQAGATLGDGALGKCFILHIVVMPLLLLGLIGLHVLALRSVGSSHPPVLHPSQEPVHTIPFHPYYTVKDLWAVSVLLLISAVVIFYYPDGGGHFLEAENAIPADPDHTPSQIHPVWYLTPWYGLLQFIPGNAAGLCAVSCAIAVWFFLPWLDRSPVRALAQRPLWARAAFALMILALIGLGGVASTDAAMRWRLPLLTALASSYFGFFCTLPLWSGIEGRSQVSSQVNEHDQSTPR